MEEAIKRLKEMLKWKYFKQEKIEIMNNVKLKIKKIC